MHANTQINIHPSTEKTSVLVHHRIRTGSHCYEGWATAHIVYDEQGITWFLNSIEEIREFASKLESLSAELFNAATQLEIIRNVKMQANNVG